jgi:hypothetical protein
MSEVIKLYDNQSANPNECGSCLFFKRIKDDGELGFCKFKLPPHIALNTNDTIENNNDYNPINQVDDKYNCDMYKSANRVYMKTNHWTA